MRRILHPGPPALCRHAAAAAASMPLAFEIEAGETANTGIARGLAAAGCDGAYLDISEGRFDPFRFVIPAGSPGPSHAAWYSETFAPEGPVIVHEAGAIAGWRDGAPFFHCHGSWTDAQGNRAMGHMLPLESRAAHAVPVQGIGLRGATFDAVPDAETNFTLFAPRKVGAAIPDDAAPAYAVTVRPNEDIATALERFATQHRIASAQVHGIGSLNGARFETGPAMESYASELLIRKGRIEQGDNGPLATLDVAAVDVDGRVFEGVLVRGNNPVCVTFELVVVPDGLQR